MSSQIGEPPKLDHSAPKWFHVIWDMLREYLLRNRVVQGLGIEVTDAPGGGLMVSAVGLAPGSAALRQSDWEVTKAPIPVGHPDTDVWVFINPNSTLLNSLDPTDRIVPDGLGLDNKFQLNFAETSEQYIWIAVVIPDDDVLPEAHKGAGADWNGPDGDFFPFPVEFDTDDGTSGGSDNSAPANRRQITLYFPIARTYDITDNPTAPDVPDGIMLTDKIKLVQVCKTPMRLYLDCFAGVSVRAAMPWHGFIPG